VRNVACALCGGETGGREVFRKGEFRIVACAECGLGYVNPQPEAADVERYYREVYRSAATPSERKVAAKLREARAVVRALGRRAGRTVRPRLLDVGCGFGYVLKAASDAGWEARGADLSEREVAYARSRFGVDARIGPFPDPDLPPDSFDAVTMLEVLEHLPSPAAALAEAKRILAPGGTLLVRAPDFGHWKARRAGAAWRGAVVPDHLYYFSEATLAALGEKAGLSYEGTLFRFPWRDHMKAVFRKL